MKKSIAVLLSLALVLGCAGCGSVFSAEYYFSEPYREQVSLGEGEITELRNYSTLEAAIMELVYAGESHAQFRFGSYTGSLVDDLAAICLEIKTSTPIGAYAVRDISYDTSRIVSYYTADINIEYKKSPHEIASVVSVSGLGELGSHILSVLDSYGGETVVNIYSSAADAEYIRAFVEESYYADPFLTASMPAVTVAAYPEAGPDRIYVIDFSYDAMPGRMKEMDEAMRQRAEAIAGGMGRDNEANLYLRAAMILGAQCHSAEEGQDWADTAYGCLVEGRASSMGFAMGYKAICDSLGLECAVVRGERNEKGVNDHAWNIIELDGESYHVDVSRIKDNPAGAFLLSDEDLWGEYDWDREFYPPCGSELGYEDFFGVPEIPGGGDEITEPETEEEEKPSGEETTPGDEPTEPEPGIPEE